MGSFKVRLRIPANTCPRSTTRSSAPKAKFHGNLSKRKNEALRILYADKSIVRIAMDSSLSLMRSSSPLSRLQVQVNARWPVARWPGRSLARSLHCRCKSTQYSRHQPQRDTRRHPHDHIRCKEPPPLLSPAWPTRFHKLSSSFWSAIYAKFSPSFVQPQAGLSCRNVGGADAFYSLKVSGKCRFRESSSRLFATPDATRVAPMWSS